MKAYVDAKTTGTGTSPAQEDGNELVWDLQVGNFRVFNYNTQQGEISEFEFDEKNLN